MFGLSVQCYSAMRRRQVCAAGTHATPTDSDCSLSVRHGMPLRWCFFDVVFSVYLTIHEDSMCFRYLTSGYEMVYFYSYNGLRVGVTEYVTLQ